MRTGSAGCECQSLYEEHQRGMRSHISTAGGLAKELKYHPTPGQQQSGRITLSTSGLSPNKEVKKQNNRNQELYYIYMLYYSDALLIYLALLSILDLVSTLSYFFCEFTHMIRFTKPSRLHKLVMKI